MPERQDSLWIDDIKEAIAQKVKNSPPQTNRSSQAIENMLLASSKSRRVLFLAHTLLSNRVRHVAETGGFPEMPISKSGKPVISLRCRLASPGNAISREGTFLPLFSVRTTE